MLKTWAQLSLAGTLLREDYPAPTGTAVHHSSSQLARNHNLKAVRSAQNVMHLKDATSAHSQEHNRQDMGFSTLPQSGQPSSLPVGKGATVSRDEGI